MLSKILDHWETLIELQRQKDQWQNQWEQATTAYQNSLQLIDPVDAERLHRVLSESLPTFKLQTTSNGAATESLDPDHGADRKIALTKRSNEVAESLDGEPQASEGASSNPPEKDADHVSATVAENEASGEEGSPTEEMSLLEWATQTIGDGITENELFQALRSSAYASQSRGLFEILKERDAFYETDDGTIHVYSLKHIAAFQD